MEIGKTYEMRWVAMGSPRSARFYPESVTKTGSIRGAYVDADGKWYKRFFVKPEKVFEWTEVAS